MVPISCWWFLDWGRKITIPLADLKWSCLCCTRVTFVERFKTVSRWFYARNKNRNCGYDKLVSKKEGTDKQVSLLGLSLLVGVAL